MWLESTQTPTQPRPPDRSVDIVVRAWNIMGGMDWAALPIVADMLGIDDVEWLIRQLTTIRDWTRRDA